MTKTTKAARVAAAARTPSEVQTMLHDIATVLRLSAMVKAEMIRDRVEADHRFVEGRRPARLEDPTTVSA